ncbi:MAG: class I SAM-dependent methyltransferase [Sphingomonadales bacterium]|nr:class I SAM-dependent methyltransferase [Sphingomonadales bacterium]
MTMLAASRNHRPVDVFLIDGEHLAYDGMNALARDFLLARLETQLPQYDFRPHDSDGSEIDRASPLANATLVLSLLNPVLDTRLADRMIRLAADRQREVAVSGAVPGSAPVRVLPEGDANGAGPFTIEWPTQRRYGSQLNLRRMLRQKQFRALAGNHPDLHGWTVEDLLDYCGSPEGTEELLRYGEDIELDRYEACPLCGDGEVYPLHSDNGHPVMGFFTRESVYYYRCGGCDLVFLNPVVKKDDLPRIYDAWERETPLWQGELDTRYDALGPDNTSHYDNYRSLYRRWGARLGQGARVADLGGGAGEFCVYIKERRPDLDVCLIDFVVDPVREPLLKRGIRARPADISSPTLARDLGLDGLDLITLWEVIEHLRVEDLAALLGQVHALLKPGGLFAFSTPDFDDPLCRALDFWAMAPVHHISVLSLKVLEPLLSDAGFAIVDEFHESVTVKAADRWFLYGAEAHHGLASRAEASVINDFLRDDALRGAYTQKLRESNRGSELILVAQKPKD